MKKIVVFKLFCLYFVSCWAQDTVNFFDYTPLICKGPVPEDFKIELSGLVEKERQNQSGNNQQEIEQAVVFSELSNAQLNTILYSGRVLYGDELTDYVNKVADIVLKDDNAFRSKLRFYVLKSNDLNAFSTQRGIIFVSVGLLAQIETEAQLAYILCHEIIHFKNNHNLETFKKDQESLQSEDKENIGRRLKTLMTFSKENEMEADREGLNLFLKTPYGTGELNDLFDVMLYSYLPFDEVGFETTYFNSDKGYVMPEGYFLSSVANITAVEDADDALSSHPNIKKKEGEYTRIVKNRG